jgi:prolipoprotein diacylglyceryltransferase
MAFSLLWAALVAVAAAVAVLWWQERIVGDRAAEGRDLLLTAVVAGILAGRVAAMIRGGVNPLAHPLDLLIVRGGVDTGFAAAGALTAAVVVSRADLFRRLDAVAAAALAGLAGWHAGCVAQGACLGTPTGLPWGIARQGGVPRHPVEVYAALLLAAGTAALLAIRRHRLPRGAAAGAALAWAGAVRLVTEPLRARIGSGPEWWYVAGVVTGLAVLAWSVLRGRRRAAQP